MKVYEFNSTEEFENSDVVGKYNVISIVRENGVIYMDVDLTMKDIKKALEKVRDSLKDYHEFDGWFDGFIEEYENTGEIASYSGAEDKKNGAWAYSYGVEKEEGHIYIFLNLKEDVYGS